MRPLKWIVFGGFGFLGDAITRRLAHDGHEVAIFDSLVGPGSRDRRSRRYADFPDGGPSFTCGNTLDADHVFEFVTRHRDADALAFVSGQVSMLTSVELPRLDMYANFLGAFNVLEAMREVKFRGAAILASTNKVYGDLERAAPVEGYSRYCLSPVDESMSLDFRTPYGCSKGAADQYWRDYSCTYGLRTIVLRHSSMYGPGQVGEVGHGWVAWFLQEALKLSPTISISGSGKQVRDLLHVEDAAGSYIAAAANADACAGRAFNVGGGQANSLSILELVEWLGKRSGWHPAITRGPWRLSDQRCFIADNSAFTSATGWHPRISVHDGLAALLDQR